MSISAAGGFVSPHTLGQPIGRRGGEAVAVQWRADHEWAAGKVGQSTCRERGLVKISVPGQRSPEPERLGVRGTGLCAGQVMVDDELVEHVALPLLGEGVVHERIVGGGGQLGGRPALPLAPNSSAVGLVPKYPRAAAESPQ